MYMAEIHRQPGCLSYNLYQNSDEENTYLVVCGFRNYKNKILLNYKNKILLNFKNTRL